MSLADHLIEVLAPLGAVKVRRMFGGAGVFSGTVMFGLIVDEELFLKSNAATIPEFEAEGQGPFVYEKGDGARVTMSYWRIPDRLLDDNDELLNWARKALAVARQQAALKPAPAKKPSPRKTARGGKKGRH